MLDESAFSNVSLKNVYYKGTESEWERVIVGRSNDALDEAVFHFETRPASEEACNGVSWETGVDGTLIISGEGEICKNCGFTSYPGYIKKCSIGNGIDAIGEGAFSNCYMLTEITLPDTVSHIKAGAFKGCSLLTDIYYHGTEEQWNSVAIDEDLSHLNIHFVTENKEGFSISGTVKCHGDKNEVVTVELLKDGELITNQKFKGNVNTYSFDGIESGSYDVIVYKTRYTGSKHCRRWYSVDIEDESVTKDVEILLYGDVTGDGIIGNADVVQINRKIANLPSIFDSDEFYLEEIGDVSGINYPGRSISNEDVLQIRRMNANLPSVFDSFI